MKGYSHSVVQTYIRALIYEPTNIAPVLGNQEQSTLSRHQQTYLGNKCPTELSKYLQEFAHPNNKIIDGPEISICKGVGNYSHNFLFADGFKFCLGCNEMVCMHCQDSIGDQTYNLVCYSQQWLVPFHGEELRKTVIETREELAPKYNLDSVNQLTIQEIEEYYEVRQVVNARHINLSSNVPFPLYESNKWEI
jgi:hypothetical protein